MYGRKFPMLETGVFVITANEKGKDNGFLASAVTELPDGSGRICVAVNKENYTCKMISYTGTFNICVLDETVTEKVFNHFGKKSGKEINKFEECEREYRTKNGVLYIPKFTNTVISVLVKTEIDLGDTVMFVCMPAEVLHLSDEKSATQSFFINKIK